MNWDDKEDRRAYFREYYRKNRERILSRVRKYREEGKQKEGKKYDFPEDEYMKFYYQENKEKMKETSKQWKKDNREKWNKFQNRYKRIKYWEEKLENNPDNDDIKRKLNEIKNEHTK